MDRIGEVSTLAWRDSGNQGNLSQDGLYPAGIRTSDYLSNTFVQRYRHAYPVTVNEVLVVKVDTKVAYRRCF
jgi:hypothetical protein